jgi:hypothetical protein
MATLSDLRAAIAQLVGELLYPGGVPAGTNAPSPVAGVPVRVFQGYPEREATDADLAAGIVDVSVYVMPGSVNTSRYPVVDVPVSIAAPTLTWSVTGPTATLSGVVTTPQNVGLLVDKQAYLYAVQPSDTLASIATALAALIDAVQPASASGPGVTVPGSHSIIGRAGGIGTTLREVGRERVSLQIVIWAPSEAFRNAVGGVVEPGLRDLRRLKLADQSIAMVWFDTVSDTDDLGKSDLYQRTLWLNAEYASTITTTAAQIICFTETVKQFPDIPDAAVTRIIPIAV